MHRYRKITLITIAILVALVFLYVLVALFFDQAVLMRSGTFYHLNTKEKVVALTFDDGPSPIWTPRILEALKKSGIKATFFMLGKHVQDYPDIARRVAQDGHDIGIHSYNHQNLIYSKKEEVARDITYTALIIKNITGKTTMLFRPPKAWLSKREKKQLKKLGYEIILWSLNSKDWVTFDDKYIIRYILRHIQPGDIILFHDSGGALRIEGGNRSETVSTIPILAEKLRERGYRFATITELLKMEQK